MNKLCTCVPVLSWATQLCWLLWSDEGVWLFVAPQEEEIQNLHIFIVAANNHNNNNKSIQMSTNKLSIVQCNGSSVQKVIDNFDNGFEIYYINPHIACSMQMLCIMLTTSVFVMSLNKLGLHLCLCAHI